MRERDAVESNALMAAVVCASDGRLGQCLERVPLHAGKVLQNARAPCEYAYFPTTSIISLVHTTEDGATYEIASIGNEGMLGVPLFMGGGCMPGESVACCTGEAWRMPGRKLAGEFHRSAEARRVLLRYTHALFAEIAQVAVCNRHHSIHQRMCRWILCGLDRLPCNDLKGTHESIASLLGVRRESVSLEIAALRSAGLVRSERGHIEVVDRRGLEQEACECYQGLRRERDELFARLECDAAQAGTAAITSRRGLRPVAGASRIAA